jgi:hypothetical protein
MQKNRIAGEHILLHCLNSFKRKASNFIHSSVEDAFAYLRAVMNANELSERALELTQTCIGLNAANYTVW